MIDKEIIDKEWNEMVYDPDCDDHWNNGSEWGFKQGIEFAFNYIWHKPNELPDRNIKRDNRGNRGEICLVILKKYGEPVVARAYYNPSKDMYMFETYDANGGDIKIDDIERWAYIQDLS